MSPKNELLYPFCTSLPFRLSWPPTLGFAHSGGVSASN